MNPSFNPENTSEEKLPEHIQELRKREKEGAMMAGVLLQEEIVKMGIRNVFEAHGKEYPVNNDSPADALIADIQAIRLSAENSRLHLTGTDVFKETPAAKLEQITNHFEALAADCAEVLIGEPEYIEMVAKLHPALAVILQTKSRNDEAQNATKAANDDRFIIQQAA